MAKTMKVLREEILDREAQKREIKSKLLGKAGIYAIVNKVTGKFYIGQTRNLFKRYQGYAGAFKNDGNPGNRYLVKDVLKYGRENFFFRVLEFVDEVEIGLDFRYLKDLEDSYLNCADFSVYNHSHRRKLKLKGIRFKFDKETGLYSWSIDNPEI